MADIALSPQVVALLQRSRGTGLVKPGALATAIDVGRSELKAGGYSVSQPASGGFVAQTPAEWLERVFESAPSEEALNAFTGARDAFESLAKAIAEASGKPLPPGRGRGPFRVAGGVDADDPNTISSLLDVWMKDMRAEGHTDVDIQRLRSSFVDVSEATLSAQFGEGAADAAVVGVADDHEVRAGDRGEHGGGVIGAGVVDDDGEVDEGGQGVEHAEHARAGVVGGDDHRESLAEEHGAGHLPPGGDQRQRAPWLTGRAG